MGASTWLPFTGVSPVMANLSMYWSPEMAETLPQTPACSSWALLGTLSVNTPFASMFLAVWRLGRTET